MWGAVPQEFPEYDRCLLEGMVDDQGGDVKEVQAMLRRMKRQRVHGGARPAGGKAAAAGGKAAAAGGKPEGKAKGSGKRGHPAAAAAAAEEDEEPEEEDDDDCRSNKGRKAAVPSKRKRAAA